MPGGSPFASVPFAGVLAGTSPVVVTSPPVGVAANSVTFAATVNPQGLDATVVFEWGLTTGYGNTTPPQDAGFGSTNVGVQFTQTGLTAGTTYHYRAVATTVTGTGTGLDVAFATLPTVVIRPLFGSPFRYRAYDLITLQPLDVIPYVGVTFSRKLPPAGSFAGNVPITSPQVQKLNYLRATQDGATTLLVVEYLGVPIWAGIIWTSDYARSSGMLAIGAQELDSYWAMRFLAFDYSNTFVAGWDPMLIAQKIYNEAQAVNAICAGGIPIVLNPMAGEGGPKIAPSYSGSSLRSVQSVFQELSSQGYGLGFDYTDDVAYLSGTTTPLLTRNVWYPRAGRPIGQSRLKVLIKHCLDFRYTKDSTQRATAISETGSGSGSVQPETLSTPLPDVPLLERAFSRTSVDDQQTLTQIAFGDAALYMYGSITPKLILPLPVIDVNGLPDPNHLAPGDFQLGDDLIVQIDPLEQGGPNTDPRFPQGLDYAWRIVGWTILPEGKPPQIQIDLAMPGAETLPPPPPPN